MSEHAYTDATILVLDDKESVVWELVNLLSNDGYRNIQTATRADQVEYLCRRFHPDLLLLDLHLPGRGSFNALEEVTAEDAPFAKPAVLGLLHPELSVDRRKALRMGVTDFLEKPFDALLVSIRVYRALEIRDLEGQLSGADSRQDAERAEAQLGVLQVLARLVEFRDFTAEQHGQRVGELSGRIARRLGVSEEKAAEIEAAAGLHDIGMILVPDRILLKEGALTEEEEKLVRMHPRNGARILSESSMPVLETARIIALTHHERWDGTGYPEGLHGTQIPMAGRIVAVADAFEAMTHRRPFREAMGEKEAIVGIKEERGEQFDPQVVDALLEVLGYDVPAQGWVGRRTGLSI